MISVSLSLKTHKQIPWRDCYEIDLFLTFRGAVKTRPFLVHPQSHSSPIRRRPDCDQKAMRTLYTYQNILLFFALFLQKLRGLSSMNFDTIIVYMRSWNFFHGILVTHKELYATFYSSKVPSNNVKCVFMYHNCEKIKI